MDGYRVGEVAALAGVSVRTMHHYDEIGLLPPSGRSSGGYRLYTAEDLRRLQQIMFYRELGFGLDDIAAMLADPNETTDDHLRRQHRLLRERLAQHEELLRAIEKEMEARQMGISLTPEEQLKIFGSDKFTGEYTQEAEQRWGETDAWKESQRRTSAYSKQDWVEIKAEDDAIRADFADAMARGVPADSAEATAIAERHRRHISDRFYACAPEFHRRLAELYVADGRFRANYDDVAPGLAHYVHDAIIANGERG
jgi:DNA-binding transcriptional MerR regulator